MYKAYNLKIESSSFPDVNKNSGNQFKKILEVRNKTICSSIKSLIDRNGVLDGDKLSELWFPVDRKDVFISHSHADRNLAISIAERLTGTLGLKCFIDSEVWGHYEDLLKVIDERFCKTGSDLYSYKKRNISTAHVHMMLMLALIRMMDESPCLLFLNTPNSVKLEDDIEQTESPWILSEVAMASMIRLKEIQDSREFSLNERAVEWQELRVRRKLPLNGLKILDERKFLDWVDYCSHNEIKGRKALEYLFSSY